MTYRERMGILGVEFLGRLYELSGGDWHKDFSFYGIGDDLGWDRQTTGDVVQHVVEQEFARYPAFGQVQLTRAGVDAWEQALKQAGEGEKSRAIGFRAAEHGCPRSPPISGPRSSSPISPKAAINLSAAG